MLHGLKGIFMDKLAGAIAPDEAADQADGAAEAPVRNVTPKLPAESPIEATAKKSKSPASKAKPTKPKSAKTAPAQWTFPKNKLEEAIKVARAIEEQNAGNPMKPDMLAKAVGFPKMDWRFGDILKSANLYGLVNGTGAISPVSLTDIGRDVVSPSSASARPAALLNAFRSVDQFSRVQDFYKSKKLPEDEFFENTLIRDFDIPRDRVKAFIDTFTSNLNYLHAFRVDRSSPGPTIPTDYRSSEPEIPSGGSDESSGRQFLDTCFVMMPFGAWMDTYYKEIFVPAIKEAGMEPIRADELFSTGSVIEQIWEQISGAKVLLADLTGKNANVFYELGLAHAAHKPVVFTTGNLDDVPFDLRHLRVAVYDIRDPAWGEKLKESLSAFLKAAKAEPIKSVPQPFREKTPAEAV
jgi:hypothetical protein